MWKVIDISGFRTTSTTCGYIIKYIKYGYDDLHFQLVFTNDYHGDEEFHFEGNNIRDISKFHNILKNNGSSVIYAHANNTYKLIGKKLMSIMDDTSFHILDTYEKHPLDFDNIETFDSEPTDIKLIEIFKEQWSCDYSDEYWNILIA